MNELQAAIDDFFACAEEWRKARDASEAAWGESCFPNFTAWLTKASEVSDLRDAAKEKWSKAWDRLFELRSNK